MLRGIKNEEDALPKEVKGFAKGNSFGSKSNKLPPECKVAKEQTKAAIIRICHRMTHEPKKEFLAFCLRPEATAYEELVGKAYKTGAVKFIQWNLEMSVGKPTTLNDPEEKISNIEHLVRSLAKKKDPFKPEEAKK